MSAACGRWSPPMTGAGISRPSIGHEEKGRPLGRPFSLARKAEDKPKAGSKRNSGERTGADPALDGGSKTVIIDSFKPGVSRACRTSGRNRIRGWERVVKRFVQFGADRPPFIFTSVRFSCG
jgi:hypothetical protein